MTAAILENDTENEKKTDSRFGIKNERNACLTEGVGAPEGEREWIKHKSLILAQDERWRRA